MVNPVPGYQVTTGYGRRGTYWSCRRVGGQGIHTGIDYAAPVGTPVVAARPGTVIGGGWGAAYGTKQVLVRADNGEIDLYAHLSAKHVGAGQRVEAGQRVGSVGKEGNVTGAHLHLETRRSPYVFCTSQVDPSHVVAYAAPTPAAPKVTIGAGKVYVSKLRHGVRDSDSVRRLQQTLNGISLRGGVELPVTGNFLDQTLAEVKKWQEQVAGDPPDGELGPRQAQRLFAGTGHEVVDDLTAPSAPPPPAAANAPAAGAPPLPSPDQFKPGTRHDSFTDMGRRFLVWLPGDQIARQGAAYEPGPTYSTYDDENVRRCQVKMGDPADPAGRAYFGPQQWARLFAEDPAAPSPPPPEVPVAPAASGGVRWIPGAVDLSGRTGSYAGGGQMEGGPPRAVWHTVEAPAGGKDGNPNYWFDLADRVLTDKQAWSTVLYDPVTDRLGQYFPLDRSARALRDPEGGVRTNRAGVVCIQVEVLGYAAQPFTNTWQPGPGFRALLAAIRSWGIPDEWPAGPPPVAHQQASAYPRQVDVWSGRAGHYGHSQVPENSHTDPGAISTTRLFAGQPGSPGSPEEMRMTPSAYFVGARGEHVTWLGQRLVAHGYGSYYKVGPGPVFTESDRQAVAAFQRAQGWTGADADGLPGNLTLARLAADPTPQPQPDPASQAQGPLPETPGSHVAAAKQLLAKADEGLAAVREDLAVAQDMLPDEAP